MHELQGSEQEQACRGQEEDIWGCDGGFRRPANKQFLQAEARLMLVAAVRTRPAESMMCKL